MKAEKTLTIFTPTYNRAYTLSRCYEALKCQTSKDFVWLVIDDGSTDETAQLIKSFMEERVIDIEYVYQQNQGMHGAHNAGIRNAHTLLWTICDSDDYFSHNAVETILSYWKKYAEEGKHIGLICRISDITGTHISDFPQDRREVSTYELNYTLRIKSDFRPIYLLSAVNKDFFPIFPDERYMPCGWKYIINEGDKKLILIDEALYIVEYLEDGCTTNKVKQFFDNPLGFLFVRTQMLRIAKDRKAKRDAKILYLTSCILARQSIFKGRCTTKDCIIYCLPAEANYIKYCIKYLQKYHKLPRRKKHGLNAFSEVQKAEEERMLE